MKKAVNLGQRRTLFLGGTIGYSSWREQVTELTKRKYLCRNPMQIEDKDVLFRFKRDSDIILYTISPFEKGVYESIAELVDAVNNNPLFTMMLLLEEDNGIMWTDVERNELIKLANICNLRGIRGGCFYNINDLCTFLNKY